MRSLDDLELEHESGGIDDESYAELHDDYTARAAAVIRTLRDGVDVTPAPRRRAPARDAPARRARRAWCVVFAIAAGHVAGVRARCPPPRADGVGQLAGGAVDHERGRSRRWRSRSTTCEAKVNAEPDDYDLRLELAARVRGEQRPPERARSSPTPRSRSTRTVPKAHANAARLLYLASEQVADKDSAGRSSSRRRCAGFNQAIAVGPDYADAYFFRARALLAATARLRPRRRSTCRTTSCKAPNGTWADAGASAARAGHDGARNPVDYRAPDRPRRGRSSIHGAAPRVRDRHRQDLPRDHHHRPRHDRRRPRPEARAEHGEQLRRAVAPGLLRRPHVPPGRARLRDPGWRPRGHAAPAVPATSGTTSRCWASTRSARWRWPTPGPNTNGSQFFVATADCTRKLTKSYNLFGYVIEGMDVALGDPGGRRDAHRSTIEERSDA